VEVLTVTTLVEEACPGVSPLVFGAVLMTQATSIWKVSFYVDSTAFTGPDTAILVRSCSIEFISRLGATDHVWSYDLQILDYVCYETRD